MGDAGEKVGPGQRARVGIGDVDLELGNQHEQDCGRDCPSVMRKYVSVSDEIHLVRIHGSLHRHQMADGEPS